MLPTLGDVVHAVLQRGLDLRERLDRGETPSIDVEQAILKDLLLAENEAMNIAQYGPDRDRPRGTLAASPAETRETVQSALSDFLGVRYALTCWLDELFTLDDSDWSARWNEQKLEVELYGSNDRSWRFWQQAELAQARSGDDALEVFFLCVMLGFRGDLRRHDRQLRSWVASARHRLGRVQEIEWPYASQLNVPLPARPLAGRRMLRAMVMTVSLVVVAVAPVMAFLLIWRLGR